MSPLAPTAELREINQQLEQELAKKNLLQRDLSYQATHNPLTGLFNRSEFESRLTHLIGERRQGSTAHAMCYIDLDQFKLVNDTCGHLAGDELLRQLSRVLARNVRGRDTLARLGGDEFGVLIAGTYMEKTLVLVERLRHTIESFSFMWNRRRFKITGSFGVSLITDNSMTPIDVMRDADAACYLAKDNGRNRVHVHKHDDAVVIQRRGQMGWINRLDTAITDDRLVLARQRIASATGLLADHWEILVRFQDETGNIVSPVTFLPAAERYGMMPQIDRWVVQRVLDYLEKNDSDQDIYATNLSANSLTNERLIDFVHDAVKNSPHASRLCFEITETQAIANLDYVADFIKHMKTMGCRFSLDDFGTGMASFDYLRSLPVDYLKIDGSFITDIDHNPISLAMVRAVNDIAHLMGIETIAEFVESEAIANVLREIKVDYLQGYALGKPGFFMGSAD